jgi:hypothetical protein
MNQMTDDDYHLRMDEDDQYEMWYTETVARFATAINEQGPEYVLNDLFNHVRHHERALLLDAMTLIVRDEMLKG